MKKVMTKFLAFSSIGLLMLASCKKNDALVTSNGGKPGALSASTTSLVLDKTKLDSTSNVISFSFTPPNFGYNAAITNTLQIDAAGDNWAKPMSVTLGTKVYSQGYSTADFNALLLKLNLPAGVSSQVNVRIVNSISATVAPVYSNVLSLAVTPFNLISFVYVPGAYEGWSNPGPQEDSLVSATGNGIYTGIINFTDGNNQFLIVPVKGSWATKYATTGNPGTGTSASYTTELVASGGNNFYAPSAAGQYLVTLNVNTNTLSIVPADYYSLIGADFSTVSADQWNIDYFMKFINDGSNNWVSTINFANPTGGGFKIRQDAAWGNSWGTSATTGILTDASGGNINSVTTTGNYTVSFTMAPSALGSPAVTTAAYAIAAQ